MHEAGIAVAIADEVRRQGIDPARIRIVASGGHGDSDAFDAALRAHLDAVAPELALGAVEIVHTPTPRLCVECVTEFEAASDGDPCPACGGAGLALPVPPSVDIEWSDESGPEGVRGAAVLEAPHEDGDEPHAHELHDAHAYEPHAYAPHAPDAHLHDGPDLPRGDDGGHSALDSRAREAVSMRRPDSPARF